MNHFGPESKTVHAKPDSLLQYAAARLKVARQYRNAGPAQAAKLLSPPEPRKSLIKELKNSELLGTTLTGNQVFLVEYSLNSAVLRELGRLRELSFRAVGEGTLRLRDLDKYDKVYRHVVLWNNSDQEIVGAYRIGEAFNICTDHNQRDPSFVNTKALYTHELFAYQPKFTPIIQQGIELGRSFIQPKYWSSRGLDSLWQAIGAYLSSRPEVRYLFGAVSISNEYPDLAKQEIVGLYRHFYQPEDASSYAIARSPFISNRAILESFRNQSLAQAHALLRHTLNRHGVVLPTLYKHYAELCSFGGVRFIDFNVDSDFSMCIDGLIVADLNHIKESKKRRYLKPTQRVGLDLNENCI